MAASFTRRELLKVASAGSLACLAEPRILGAALAPAAPVAIARCETYESAELLASLTRVFDQLGGLGKLVKGKTVAVKINCTGSPTYRLGYLPLGDTHYTNPHLIAAAVHLMGRAGARRIRVLESPWSSADPLEETLFEANWEPREILEAAPNVEFENTNYLGQGKKYSRLKVPFGGYIYPAYDLNHSYEDCDVFVSLTKLKEHETVGFTASIKNCFGITPCSIYGAGAGVDGPNEQPKGGRGILHSGHRQPSRTAPSEKDPSTPRVPGYRVPRIVVDLIAARPVQLSIVDSIRTMSGGEGPWAPDKPMPVRPGVLVAGTNPVSTDAVCLSIMGYDPMSDRGTAPFIISPRQGPIDNMLRLAEDAGLGTRDLKRIEVVGARIEDVKFDFAGHRAARAVPPGARHTLG
jgi:uncharacterized protein (DUF362 family)